MLRLTKQSLSAGTTCITICHNDQNRIKGKSNRDEEEPRNSFITSKSDATNPYYPILNNKARSEINNISSLEKNAVTSNGVKACKYF